MKFLPEHASYIVEWFQIRELLEEDEHFKTLGEHAREAFKALVDLADKEWK